MTDTLDDLLGDASTPAAQPEPTPAAKPAPQAQPEPQAKPRDETGRFKPKAEDPPTVEATPAAPVVQPPAPPPERPLTQDDVKAIIEYRQKWQSEQDRATKAEKEAKSLRERLEQQQAKPIPDFMSDPEGYASHLQTEIQRTALNSRFETSEVVARQAHGDETVQAAMDWGMAQANESQAFAAEYVKQRHPVDWIVKRFKQNQFVSQVGDDPDAFVMKRYAEIMAAQGQQPNPQTPQAPASPQSAPQPLPTPSLATAPGASAPQHVPEAPLEEIFKR